MATTLRPLPGEDHAGYPGGGRLLRGLFLAAAVSATSLGGCGPAMDSRTLNHSVDQGDLDAAVECPGAAAPGTPGCPTAEVAAPPGGAPAAPPGTPAGAEAPR